MSPFVSHLERSICHSELPLCHPELVSGSKDQIFKILKQVQNDKNLEKTVCHAEFISASKNTIGDVRSLGGAL